ncbi:MAG: calcium-translocating P-type ATPase, SERCA-type [Anaerolineales bacterium]|nr:calcium-translocating P-type ATPase, SERCA-type [Anaerolineales bacterium]
MNIKKEIVKAKDHWFTEPVEVVLSQFGVTREEGLSPQEAAERMEVFGKNELEEGEGTSIWAMIYEQFANFVVILLLVAALISALLGDWVEAAAIMTIVVLNAVLGVVQERRAEEALAALKKMASPDADVLRGGHRKAISAREIVPGDIVFLEAGNFIPADVRLLETVNLRIDEAALTGESVPVSKNAGMVIDEEASLGDRKTMAYTGTMVTYGRGVGVVVSTGMDSEIGQIAEMLQGVEDEETPLQKKLDNFGRTLGWAAIAISGIIFVEGMITGTDPLEMFIIAVSLAIAAVPEGLPAVVTITLALGMQEMIERNALIRKLSSVETLGSTTIICSDKTGTLTQNEMTVTQVAVDGEFLEVTGTGYQTEGKFKHEGKEVDLSANYPGILTALWIAALNNDASLETDYDEQGKKVKRMVGDPTEGAMLVAAAKAGALPAPLAQAYPRIEEIPFDSERKRMVTVHAIENPNAQDVSPFYDERKQKTWYVVTQKGAPDVVLDRCTHYQSRDDEAVPLSDEQRKRILEANDKMTSQALRVLGVAYKVVENLDKYRENGNLDHDVEEELIFVGLLGMIDPPRPEVIPALNKAREAGIRTVMITGDYSNTAEAIAREIDLMQEGHKVLTGKDLDTLDDQQLREEVNRTDVFARVSPEHKVRIVEALKANNQIVAMTGDGVNDAPSIKKADIGIAMGITGTDVAKETADMVLTDDNYASIVSAVEQGRVIYSNIRKFVYFLLSCNIAEITTIFVAIMLGWKSPLSAIQLLWLNLISDGAPALALGMEKGEPDLMERPPRDPDEPILNRYMRQGIGIQTLAIAGVTLTAYWIGLRNWPAMAATMAFVTLSFSELLRAYTARSERMSVFKIGLFKNKYMNWAILSSLTLLLVVIYVPFLQNIFGTIPLGWAQWRVILPLLVGPSVAAEVFKALTNPPRDKETY